MLTKKHLQLYNFIKNYIEENKISPSYDEMKKFLNLKSKSGIFHYLNSIEKLGYIRKINKKSRIVEIVKNRDEFFDLKKQLSSVISENNRLRLQNARLQSELDKTIKQLKDYEKTLKEYADGYNYAYVDNGFAFYSNQYSNEGLAQEVLEKWENK